MCILGGSDHTVIGNDGDGLKSVIKGAGSSNIAKVTSAQELGSVDVMNGPGVHGTLTIGTSPVEIKVGASVHPGRKLVSLANTTSQTLYWGFTNSVTTANGTPIYKNQTARWGINDLPSAKIWVIAATTGNIARVTEGA
jgi:hypothetical protein